MFQNTYENYARFGSTRCGEPGSGYLYLTTFYMLVSFIFFNLLIAVLLESFEIAHNQEETLIKHKDIEVFRKAWSEYDPNGVGMVERKDLPQFIKKLGAPFSPLFSVLTTDAFNYFIGSLMIPLYRKRADTK